MEISFSWELLLLLFAVACVAGFIDTLAGGGGLLTIPVLLLCQLSPVQALATNKAQAVAGSFTATLRMLRKKLIRWSKVRRAFLMSLIGSAIGTGVLHLCDAGALMFLVPVVLILVALYFAFAKNVGQVERQQRINDKQYVYGVVPAIGFYDGFFGPGTGSFFSFANVALMGRTIVTATANAKSLNFASNIASLAVFIFSGYIVWPIAVVMLLGQVVGAFVGSHYVEAHGQKIIRPLIVIMSLIMCGKLLWEQVTGI